jgi:predicted TIM-barrel fold metal-dependent hydrolase
MTRREILIGGSALAFAKAGFAKASQPSTPVNFEVPAHACDCHTHIIADPKQFPMWSGRTYTPETSLPEEMSALHRALHMERVVIVTPSVYGADNAATLYGMKARGPSARGVAVIDERTSAADLESMDRAGIRGVRLNLATVGQNDPAVGRQKFQALAALVKRPGWHMQINTGLGVLTAIKSLVLDAPMPVVFDHFAGLSARLGIEQPGFPDLVDLVHSGKAYVKLSAAYRASTMAPDYADMAPFAKALVAANPARVLWGSDWPHPDTTPGKQPGDISPFLAIDDGRMLNQFAVWAPDPAIRKQILVDNPTRLYGFRS